jgi:hypothetical protein
MNKVNPFNMRENMKMKTLMVESTRDDEISEDDFKNIVLKSLYVGIQQVTFTKKDGTQRTLICTLRPDLLPPKPELAEGEEPKVRAKTSTDAICVFETDLQEWRAFNLSNVIAIRDHQEGLYGM